MQSNAEVSFLVSLPVFPEFDRGCMQDDPAVFAPVDTGGDLYLLVTAMLENFQAGLGGRRRPSVVPWWWPPLSEIIDESSVCSGSVNQVQQSILQWAEGRITRFRSLGFTKETVN